MYNNNAISYLAMNTVHNMDFRFHNIPNADFLRIVHKQFILSDIVIQVSACP